MYEQQLSDPCVESDFCASRILLHSSLFPLSYIENAFGRVRSHLSRAAENEFYPVSNDNYTKPFVHSVAYFAEKINGAKILNAQKFIRKHIFCIFPENIRFDNFSVGKTVDVRVVIARPSATPFAISRHLPCGFGPN